MWCGHKLQLSMIDGQGSGCFVRWELQVCPHKQLWNCFTVWLCCWLCFPLTPGQHHDLHCSNLTNVLLTTIIMCEHRMGPGRSRRHGMECVWRPEDNCQELVNSFHGGFRGPSSDVHSQSFYSMSHLVSPSSTPGTGSDLHVAILKGQ